jgi:START domain
MRRMRGWIAPGMALAVLFTSATLPAEEPWKTQTTKGALTLERRAVPGSSYYEYRIKTESPASPKGVVDGLWSGLTEDLPSSIAKRELVSRSENEMVVYDQIKTPVVSDRDLVLRLRRVTRPNGAIEVSFQTVDTVGPPPNPKMVRIPVVRGGWTIEPAPSGGSQLTYTCYSEPGGSVPAILVRGAQEDQVFLDVQRILKRARPNAH